MLGKWFTTELYLSLEKWSHYVALVGLELIVYVAHVASDYQSTCLRIPVSGRQLCSPLYHQHNVPVSGIMDLYQFLK